MAIFRLAPLRGLTTIYSSGKKIVERGSEGENGGGGVLYEYHFRGKMILSGLFGESRPLKILQGSAPEFRTLVLKRRFSRLGRSDGPACGGRARLHAGGRDSGGQVQSLDAGPDKGRRYSAAHRRPQRPPWRRGGRHQKGPATADAQ